MALKMALSYAPNDGKTNGYAMIRIGKSTHEAIKAVAEKSGKTVQVVTEELIAYAISEIEWEGEL